jgi:UDP-glucose 4-epimerase
MKILITGSSGFIGKYLVNKLSKKHNVILYDIASGQDVLNQKLLLKSLRSVDLVIHLAALISASESWEKPIDYVKNNSLGTLSVITTAISAKVKKVILFSSAAVKAKPFTPYAVSKISAEQIAKLYSDKINTIIVRPENIYGLGQKESYGYVFHSFIKAIKFGNPIQIYGTGNQTRDFIYINDIVNVIEKLISLNVKSGTVMGLGTGKEVRIKDLAQTIMKIMRKKVDIIFLGQRKEPYKSVADLNVLKKLGFNPKEFLDLESGVRKMLHGYRDASGSNI